MGRTSDSVSLHMPGRFENIDLFQYLGEQLAELCGFDSDGSFWIGLSIREALNNAILHGNKKDASKEIHVTFTLTPDELEIAVRDEGFGFAINVVPDPLKPNNLLKTSGRGIFYIKNYMDRIDLSRAAKEGGEIRMSKRCPKSARPK